MLTVKFGERDRAIHRARIVSLWLAAAFLAVGVPLLLALLAISREPNEWHWSDWAAQLTQIATGVIFFGLAWFLGRKSETRSEAVANGVLITSMGALSTTSARSYAGYDAQSLRIAADARAALQHYLRADYREQHKLTEKVIDAFSDLTFGTFSRANGLPRSIWTGLHDGARDLIADTDQLVKKAGRRHSAQRSELLQMTQHIRFALSLGNMIRSPGERFDSVVAPTSPRRFEKIWRSSGSRLTTIERLDQFELLYRRELTVIRDWSLLRKNPESVDCSIVLHDVLDSDNWYAPWYVMRGDNGRVKPVNVRGDELREVARFDQLADISEDLHHPKPLRHADVPVEMRQATISDHVRVLKGVGAVTICVLSYELICNDNSTRRRVILDGNHRLAAARRLAKEQTNDPEARSIHVLEFLISERERLDDPAPAQEDLPDWNWRGFTPDVENVRYAWAKK